MCLPELIPLYRILHTIKLLYFVFGIWTSQILRKQNHNVAINQQKYFSDLWSVWSECQNVSLQYYPCVVGLGLLYIPKYREIKYRAGTYWQHYFVVS